MATDLQTILSWFKTGLKPTQAQFWASWSSFWHKDEAIPQSSISGLTNVLNAKTENDQFNAYKVANDARMQAKEDKTQKGAPNGYAPLDEFTKLAGQYLNIVNDLVTGGATALLSAEQGKVLQMQISAINTLLTSDNVNLDTVQELVDAIETVQMSLSSILVNDLTTGGTTKALTAEMGKQLDLIKESTANKSTSIVVDYLSNIKFPSVKAVYDFCMSAFKKKFLAFGDVPGITHTFGAGSENTMFKFSNNNPITATIPPNATTPFEIGTVFETIAIGNGAMTVTGAPGVTILTNLSNTSVKNEVRRYTKIDTDTWTVEGNLPEKIFVPNTIFIGGWPFNDLKAEPGNPKKAFFSLDAAIRASNVDTSFYKFVFINQGTYYITESFLQGRAYYFESEQKVTLSFENATFNVFGNFPNFANSVFSFNAPNGTLIFKGIGQFINEDNATFLVNCKEIINESFYTPYPVPTVSIVAKKLTSKGMNIVGRNSFVSIDEIEADGGTLIKSTKLDLNFKSCKAKGGFTLAVGPDLNITHGTYFSEDSYKVLYIRCNGGMLNINFSTGASISGIVAMQEYNSTYTAVIKGTCDFTNNSVPYFDTANRASSIVLDNVNFKGLAGLVAEEYNPNLVVEIINSYLELKNTFIDCYYWNSATPNRTKPVARFLGHNTLYFSGTNKNIISINGHNNQYIDVIGELKTNGTLSASVTKNTLL